jgi:formylmethanofuran dehydrogenase subunit E
MEDETLCERCGEPVESSDVYETADGDYVCLSCYTNKMEDQE